MTDKEKISQRNTRENSSRKVVGFKRPPHDILKSDTLIGDEVYDRGINEEETDWRTNKIEVLGGVAVIYTTPRSGGNYQFRMWLPDERKYFWKSLRTSNTELAIKKAEELYIATKTETSKGYKYYAITFSSLVEHYKEHQRKRVDRGVIMQGRYTTITTQLKHFLDFVGANNQVTHVTGVAFRDYYAFRQNKHPEVKDTTLKNERSTITNLYKFGRDSGYLNLDSHPKFEELRFSAPSKRNAFLDEDYRSLYTYLNRWEKDGEDERDVYLRKLIRDFIFIKANTGIRFGELKVIRWEDVSVFKTSSEDGRKLSKERWTATVRIDATTAKTRRERLAVGECGRFFERIKEYSPYTRAKDFVFADFKDGSQIEKTNFYRYWDKIINESDLKDCGRTYTYYSLRHYYATKRLQEGRIDIYALSKVMGTSVKNIEDHYGQIVIAEMRDYITRR